MNIKSIVIGVIVIAALAGGAYFIFMNDSSGTGNPQNATTTEDRVEAQDVTVGSGASAEPGTVVSVLYVGRLADGTIFDSSEANGNQPLVFQLGAPNIIPGFQIGINGMREGGERRLAVPPTLGYGDAEVKHPTTGAVVIPANSTLVFDVKLVKVDPAPTSTTPAAQQ